MFSVAQWIVSPASMSKLKKDITINVGYYHISACISRPKDKTPLRFLSKFS